MKRTHWNEQYLEIFSMSEAATHKRLLKHERLSQFANDFVYAAESYLYYFLLILAMVELLYQSYIFQML